MKNFVCKYCGESWKVNQEKSEKILCCPFCRKDIAISRKTAIISFETAVCRAIDDMSIEILKKRQRFIAYLLDISNEYKKEIHILSNACDDKTFEKLYSIAQKDFESAIVEIKKLRDYLVSDEGISEKWANTICKSFYEAFGFAKIQDSLKIDDINVTENLNINISNPNIEKSSESIKKDKNLDIKPGDEVEFGNKTTWKVLDIVDEHVLLCDLTFDEKRSFHNIWSSKICWKNCTLRKWLNNDYIKQICNEKEIQFIVDTKMYTGGYETIDKIFCLSKSEANKYSSLLDGGNRWLLRDKGTPSGNVATYSNGKVDSWGVIVNYEVKVIPCINVSIDYFI